MPNKKVYVVFSENNARVHINPKAVPKGAILVNPNDLPKNTPPHYWKLQDGKIVAMNHKEKANRIKVLPKGAAPEEKQRKYSIINQLLLPLSAGIIIGAALWQLLHF